MIGAERVMEGVTRVGFGLGTLALASLLAGASVSAQSPLCPAEPAVDGVYMTFGDRVVRYQQLSDGQTAEVEVMNDDGASFEYRTHPIGMGTASWELSAGRIAEGSFETVRLSNTSGPVPAPSPGIVWSGTETSRFTSGSSTDYAFVVEVDGLDTLDIGSCGYTGYPITVTRTDVADGFVSQDAFGYIIELGVVIYLGHGEGEGNITYDFPTGISAFPPNADGSLIRVDNK